MWIYICEIGKNKFLLYDMMCIVWKKIIIKETKKILIIIKEKTIFEDEWMRKKK